jgi:ABC-type glycerol-3-phosphate transport system substrate-binding protein
MRVRGRRSLLGAALAAALLVSAACSSSGGSANHGALSAKAKTSGETLKLYNDKGAWSDYFKQVGALAKQQIGSNLDPVGYTDEDTYQAFIKASLRTKVKPDLFTWATGGQLKSLVDQGAVADTSKVWADAIDRGYLTKQLEPYYTINGKQYCVPLNVAYWVMYYNKKIFADNNLQVPKTWDDLISVADTLVSKGITPFHQMNIIFEFVWFQALLVGSDPDAYQGLETGDTKYTDQPVVDAVKKWYEMENKKYFIDPGVQTDPQTLLKTGKVAMEYFGTFFTGQLTSIGMKSDEDYGVFVLPNVSPDVSKQQMVLETGPLCVGAGSANEKAALDYSAWWMGQDAQQAWSDKRGDVSFNPKVKAADPALSALLAGQADWQIQKRWLEATPNPIYTVASPAFGEFVTNPTADPMPMLTKIQQAADKYWSEQ